MFHPIGFSTGQIGLQELLLHSWKFFPNSTPSRWSPQGHMISNNETVSCKKLSVGNIAKSMTSEGNRACNQRMLTHGRHYIEV